MTAASTGSGCGVGHDGRPLGRSGDTEPRPGTSAASSDSMIDSYRHEIAVQTHRANALELELKRLREALTYYAEGRYPDSGEIAREALSRV